MLFLSHLWERDSAQSAQGEGSVGRGDSPLPISLRSITLSQRGEGKALACNVPGHIVPRCTNGARW